MFAKYTKINLHNKEVQKQIEMSKLIGSRLKINLLSNEIRQGKQKKHVKIQEMILNQIIHK